MRSLVTAALAAILTVPAVASAQGAPYSSPLYSGCGVYSCATFQGTITPRVEGSNTVYDLLATGTFTLLPSALTAGFELAPLVFARPNFFGTPGYSSFFADAGFLDYPFLLSQVTAGVPRPFTYPTRGIPFQPTFTGVLAGIDLASNTNLNLRAQDHYALVETVTPEPTTLALSMAGIGAVAFLARRRRVS